MRGVSGTQRRSLCLRSDVRLRDVFIPSRVGRCFFNATNVDVGGAVTMVIKARNAPDAVRDFCSVKGKTMDRRLL